MERMATQMEKDRERLEGGTKDIIQQKLKTKLVSGNAPSDYMWTIPGVIHSVRWLSKGKDDFTSVFAKLNFTSLSPNPIPRATFEQFSYRDQLAKLKISRLLFFLFSLFLSQLDTFKSNGHIDYSRSTHEDRSWPICFRVIASPKEIPGSINKFADYSKYHTLSEFWLSNLSYFYIQKYTKHKRYFCKKKKK